MATSYKESHSRELHHYCRVCANKIKGYKHKCSTSGSLLEAFGVYVANDNSHIHPPHYCHNCHNIAKRLQKDKGAESTLKAHTWSAHVDNECEVCSMSSPLHLGGRKKKVGKKRGRPMKESNKGIANAIQKNAPESLKVVQPLSLSRFLPPATNLSLTDFQCAICLHIVDRPVETPCRKLLCADCISESLWCQDDSTEQEMPCLCCKGSHYITSTSFTPASEVVLKVLGALLTRCDNSSCTAVVGLKHLKQHVESGCKITASTFSPSKLTIGQIISRPLQSPPTSVEQKAAANVVQRLMQTSPTTDASEGNTPSSVIKLTTEGTVSTYIHVYTCTCIYVYSKTPFYDIL